VQLPCALAWAWFSAPLRLKAQRDKTMVLPKFVEPPQERPETPDYQLQDKPFGSGAYGRVWLARNAIGQWQALKAVYMSGFKNHAGPYDREFNGITHYKPISQKHPGLLRIDFVSQKKTAGYFYYVMELGDSLTPGWEKDPSTYKPKDLASVREQAPERRLPAGECIRICLALCDALDFLHRQGLTHRDIKPQNIVFVEGQPKLADVGLIAEIRADPREGTFVGTLGYMPPGSEPPGTPKADIYGLGMVLYVILTGQEPESFPRISTALAEQSKTDPFMRLNAVILKACQPDIAQRYASAAEMRDALQEVQRIHQLSSPPPL
jgi:eukaryotic-like serine/threonine-protein kinase